MLCQKKEKVATLCQSRDLKIIYKNVIDYEISDIKFKVDILKCNNCELIQQSELFSENEIENFYLDNYHGRNYNIQNNLIEKLTVFRSRYYQRFINLLISKKIDKQIKILDFGSGDGFLANQLIKNGYKNVFCCDFFKPIYKESSINYLHPSTIGNYGESFDVVFMLNSVEHLVSFSKDFNAIVNTMNDGSILILETPNIDSPDAFILKIFGRTSSTKTYISLV